MSIDKEKSKKQRTSSFLTLPLLRDIIVVLILGVLAWKLFTSEININLGDYEFSDLLSGSLAFFAVGLSVAFYFKATETSNRFYDNIYKFTKDTSEMLGRIEAGFGEQLRHLDQGYTGLRDRFDKMPFDINEAKVELEKEKLEVEKQGKEKQAIIEELANKAQLQEKDKELLFLKIQERDIELLAAESKYNELQTRINAAEFSREMPERLRNYLEHELEKNSRLYIKYWNAPDAILREEFNRLVRDYERGPVEDMKKIGFLDEDIELTNKGFTYFKNTLEISA